MSDTLLETSMSKAGYRRMHIARMGAAPDMDLWMDQIPPDVDRSAVLPVIYKSNRDGLDMYHLQIYWYAAEVIRMVHAGGREQWSAWWWLGKEPHITYYASTAIEAAAIRYYWTLGQWPVWAAIPLKDEPGRRKVPKEIRFEYEGAEVVLPVIRIAWVPRNFVVVLGREVAPLGPPVNGGKENLSPLEWERLVRGSWDPPEELDQMAREVAP